MFPTSILLSLLLLLPGLTGTEQPRLVIGVHVSDLSAPLAAHLSLEPEQGILITRVIPGLPADRAGVARYDVITAVQGEPVDSRSSLSDALDQMEAGDAIELTLLRQARPLQLTVEVTEDSAHQDSEGLGGSLRLGELSDEYRRALEASLAARQGSESAERARQAAERARQVLERRSQHVDHDRVKLHEEALHSLARALQGQNSALDRLQSDANEITERLHQHLKELLARQQDASGEEVAHAQASIEKAVSALHNAIAATHDRLQTRKMQIIEHEDALPDVVVDKAARQAADFAAERSQASGRIEDRLQSIDERLERIEQALAEMRERRTD